MKATHKIVEGKTNRQIANEALKAMSLLCDYDNGTIKNPCELASQYAEDGTGRTIIEAIFEDGYIMYNDGFHIVEVNSYCIYVDFTQMALNFMGNPKYEIIDTVSE